MKKTLPASLLAVALALGAAPLVVPPPHLPDGTAAATRAIATFRTPPGLKVELFAAEPMLGSPVAITLDEQGRVFVAEEYRFNRGTEENRTRPFLLEDDLQLRTVDDRLAMYRKWAHKFEGGMAWFSRHADQVRVLEDTRGTGKADVSRVFAGGFNDPLDGLLAGVLARDGKVYVTCIPHLWLLEDTKGTGTADVRKPLHRGFGVNCAYLGHDLHGLTWGPDGKLYFSVGDRGFHVETPEGKTLHGPRTGGVFRCNPDGPELEVVARGLRNPQKLAFDQFGNLFADDNNCDKGDDSRLVYVVEDGDSGWNMSYQTIPEPYLTGPWHAERMWHLYHAGQPAWIVPPVGKLGAGPSGFTFTSGLSLPERYRNRFFMCNYTGNGGVESFGVRPQGAGFEMVDYHDFLKPIMATDVEVGYDGKVYVSDFVNLNWDGSSAGGRIYTVFERKRLDEPVVREVKELFHKGFRHRPAEELAKLLAHPDQRVRQRAQFTLAECGAKAAEVFGPVAARSDNQLARLHAIWGLGQIGRHHPASLRSLIPLLGDSDGEVRAQAARVLGDDRWAGAEKQLVGLLEDASLRVRFFAALALGKLRHRPAIGPLFAVLRDNQDRDPFLRHACVTALAWMDAPGEIQARARDSARSVRLAVLLVQRRRHDRQITQFLHDPDRELATEAARAINDLPLEEETAALAAALSSPAAAPGPDAEPLLRRAIYASFRIGKAEQARAVLRVVTNSTLPMAIRAEALAALRDWSAPPPRDRVTGFWRPLPARDPAIVRQVIEEALTALLSGTSGRLQADATELIGRLGVRVDDGTFFDWIPDTKRDLNTRVAGLRLLAVRKSPRLLKAVDLALADSSPLLRAEARDVLADLDRARGLETLRTALDGSGAVTEKQRALETLPRLKTREAGELLDAWGEKLAAGTVAAELRLDVLEALKAVPTPRHREIVQRIESVTEAKDPLARYRISLHGGNAERGREVFVGHAVAQCIRCHMINGTGGTAGPDLSKVASRYPEGTRAFLLESLILPNAKIAPGYGSVVVGLASGRSVAGILQHEDEKTVTILTPEGKKEIIAKKEIEERTAPTSAMPAMDRTLTLRQMRDLIEYLSGLK
jgi:quinoprotein glucose dehydrogenase